VWRSLGRACASRCSCNCACSTQLLLLSYPPCPLLPSLLRQYSHNPHPPHQTICPPLPACLLRLYRLPPAALLCRRLLLAGKQVYSDSLAAVQRLLPLPHLRAGPLWAVRPSTEGTPAEEWVTCWFGLGSDRLSAVRPPAALAGQAGLPPNAAPPAIGFDLADVADVRLAADPSLPAGGAFWLGLHSNPRWAGRLLGWQI